MRQLHVDRLRFWCTCADKSCRRARTCRGDPHDCWARRYVPASDAIRKTYDAASVFDSLRNLKEPMLSRERGSTPQ